MITRTSRFAALATAALAAAPLLWSMTAEAKSITCTASRTATEGLFAFFGERYSVECTGLGMDVAGESRLTADHTGLQVRLRVASGTTNGASTTALGYDASQLFIPGCTVFDKTVSLTYETVFCDASGGVKYIYLTATGSAP